MRWIKVIEEPCIQFTVKYTFLLSVIHRDRNVREQSAVLIRERSETIILRQPDRRL